MNQRTSPPAHSMHVSLDRTRVYIPPGGSATIHLGLTNTGENEGIFSISVTGLRDETITLETPEIRLAPAEFRSVKIFLQLPDNPELQSGSYPFEVQVSGRGNPPEVQTVGGELVIPVYSSEGRIGVMMPAIQFTVAPGSRSTTSLVLMNRGLETDVFQLHVDGIPPGWISTPAAMIRLDPGEQREVELSIQPPLKPESLAGRHPFILRVTGQDASDPDTGIDCVLTVSAFSEFSCELQPVELKAEQPGQVIVHNRGNAPESFFISFQSQGEALRFEETVGQAHNGAVNHGNGTPQVEIPSGMRVAAGESGVFEFHASLQAWHLLGIEKISPFVVRVEASSKQVQTLQGRLASRAIIPVWLFPAALFLIIACTCGFMLIISPWIRPGTPAAEQTAMAAATQFAGVTQTVAFNQTQAAQLGLEDADGDGLDNSRELALGTDPTNADSDGDELVDGDEANQRGTDPLKADTDGDALSDGEEVLRRGTDPRNPDSDQDGLADGDEVRRTTDPLNPDSDADGVRDGEEVARGTDPAIADTDRDSLLDGQETTACPDALNPDSDNDGMVDGRDLEPCDPANPALTATAGSGGATLTPPAATPTQPSATQPAATTTPLPLPANALVVFESDRDGNPEIYRLNLADQSLARLTEQDGADTQPAWSPDGSRIAFVSNRDGNAEIYVMNADGSGPLNLTNNPAEDNDPVWSPDGSKIAFASNRDGNAEIYVMDADGSDPANLTNNPAADSQPAWFYLSTLLGLSEERIVFTTDRDGNQEIYSMVPEGTGVTNLTQHPASDTSPASYQDAGQIAFVSDRDGNPEIYLMHGDGSAPANLTNYPAQEVQPAWLPGGDWIAFVTNRDGNAEIYLMRSDASVVANLTNSPAGDSNPDLYAR